MILALACAVLLLQGCAQMEPTSGTRVTFVFAGDKHISRKDIVNVSHYLMARGRAVLDVPQPRVDKVTSRSLILLLPGRKVSRSDVAKLTESTSIELYHLTSVATKDHPDRPWKMKIPKSKDSAYLFTGPNAVLIDSKKDHNDLLKQVVGCPSVKPILTGADLLPTAVSKRADDTWVVEVHFNAKGAKTFYDFTKNNPGEYLAVFYNGALISAPVINGAISGGCAFITGFTSEDQADMAVSQINAGDKIPLKLGVKYVEHY